MISAVAGSRKARVAIVIPSWLGHLNECVAHIRSFAEYCEDADTVPILIIVSSGEEDAFTSAFAAIPKVSVSIVTLRALVQKHEGLEIDEEELLRRCGKITFQSLKKFYGLLEADYDWCLLTDSEGQFIRPCNLHDEIASYEASPYIIASWRRDNPHQASAIRRSAELLGQEPSAWLGFSFYYQWLFEKRVVNSLRDHLVNRGMTFADLSLAVNTFSENLYYAYLAKLSEQFGYRIIDVRDLLARHHHDAEAIYKNCNMEHSWMWLSEADCPAFRGIYLELGAFCFMSQNTPPNRTRAPMADLVRSLPQIKYLPSSPNVEVWLGDRAHIK